MPPAGRSRGLCQKEAYPFVGEPMSASEVGACSIQQLLLNSECDVHRKTVRWLARIARSGRSTVM